jgi:hypothetical protein
MSSSADSVSTYCHGNPQDLENAHHLPCIFLSSSTDRSCARSSCGCSPLHRPSPYPSSPVYSIHLEPGLVLLLVYSQGVIHSGLHAGERPRRAASSLHGTRPPWLVSSNGVPMYFDTANDQVALDLAAAMIDTCDFCSSSMDAPATSFARSVLRISLTLKMSVMRFDCQGGG